MHQPKVIVTGAAGSIGKAMAKTFYNAGYFVVATDILDRPNDVTCSKFQRVDLERFVSNESYARGMCNELRDLMPSSGLDVLINNAAIQILGGLDTLRRAEWQQTLNVNLLAPFYLAQEFLPDLEAKNGCVVNVSSIHAKETKPDFVAYATSKAALSGMTRAMAVDLGSRVRVNAIEPAAIDTPMLHDGFRNNPRGMQDLKRFHPVGSIGQPDQVAQLTLTLASESMQFLHGTCIPFDGGISAKLPDPTN